MVPPPHSPSGKKETGPGRGWGLVNSSLTILLLGRFLKHPPDATALRLRTIPRLKRRCSKPGTAMSSAGMASARTFSSPHNMQRIRQTLATGTTNNNKAQNRRETMAIVVAIQWQRICVSAVEKSSQTSFASTSSRIDAMQIMTGARLLTTEHLPITTWRLINPNRGSAERHLLGNATYWATAAKCVFVIAITSGAGSGL
jgi:hypothetical protein